jgi:hypothetical protein
MGHIICWYDDDNDDVNLLGDNIDTVKRITETLIYASMEAGLEVNAEKPSICSCLVARM